MRFFTEDIVQNPVNLDVLTPMARVNLAPWVVSQLPVETQAEAVVEHLRKFPPGRQGLSVEWILARVDAAHKMPESLPENVVPQLITGAWDTDAEVRQLYPLGEALRRAGIQLDFLYTNRESWFGATWSPACRACLLKASESYRFKDWLDRTIGNTPLSDCFNTFDDGQLNPRFDREASNRLDSAIADMNIRAVRSVLERSGLINSQTVCAQSWAIRPRIGYGDWERADTNTMFNTQTIDGRTGNDQVYFDNGPQYHNEFLYGRSTPWYWSAFLTAIRNLRKHIDKDRSFVPTIYAPSVGEFDKLWTRWVLTQEYLKHANASGVEIVDVFNPVGGTDQAGENSLAAFVRRLPAIGPKSPRVPTARSSLIVRTGSVVTRESEVSKLVTQKKGGV